MPTAKKPEKKEKEKMINPPKSAEKYFQGIGRRKQSIARVKIFVSPKKGGAKTEPEILINGKPHKEYFSLSELREIVISPLKAASIPAVSKILVTAKGGGIRGQAESARLGIARAMVLADQGLKKTLKDLGFLTRDSRMVERKKAGFKKARRAPQFSKR